MKSEGFLRKDRATIERARDFIAAGPEGKDGPNLRVVERMLTRFHDSYADMYSDTPVQR